MRFCVSHANRSDFRRDGLRPFFEYRDLGIKDATHGLANAHVIRARPGTAAQPAWHTHALDFQMVYVLKGWVRFEYDGEGEVLLQAGDCVHQPPPHPPPRAGPFRRRRDAGDHPAGRVPHRGGRGGLRAIRTGRADRSRPAPPAWS